MGVVIHNVKYEDISKMKSKEHVLEASKSVLLSKCQMLFLNQDEILYYNNVLCIQYMDYVPLCLPCAMLQLTTATAVRWVYSIQQCYYTTHKYCIAENIWGRKLSRISSFVAICESFLHEIWGRIIHWHGKSEQSTKVFSEKIIFFTNLRKFSPSKDSCYTVQSPVLQNQNGAIA